ncbi:MAG: hypothetical protein BMS9Abin10_0089 [Gammaproteobacteria bacterium]|nr:MAG: hypothetical protein BMS9Abin10_0089 [Gammaproteobacteria bacterium]
MRGAESGVPFLSVPLSRTVPGAAPDGRIIVRPFAPGECLWACEDKSDGIRFGPPKATRRAKAKGEPEIGGDPVNRRPGERACHGGQALVFRAKQGQRERRKA